MTRVGSGAESGAAPPLPASRVVKAAWLPGPTEVKVAGGTFHADAILAAQRGVRPGSELRALLEPDPGNPHDRNAVRVYLEGHHAGFLPATLAPIVQPALRAFAAAHDGQLVACPAGVYTRDTGPEVALFLDTEPLGLAPELLDDVPELDQVLSRMLRKLDLPAPSLTGCDPAGRDMLTVAEMLRAEVDADYDRDPDAWPRAERAFRQAASRLEKAGDPMVSAAWAGVARSVRYQKGRRDDRMAAAVIALYWDRSNTDAWDELVDLACAAPHVATLLGLFRRVPAGARPAVLTGLIGLSRGRDRLGNMRPEAGKRLRAGLADIAKANGDKPSITKLARDARKYSGDKATGSSGT